MCEEIIIDDKNETRDGEYLENNDAMRSAVDGL